MPASDNVLPFVDRSANAPVDPTSPVYQLTVVRRLSREWGPALSDAEFRVLSFIVDHTILWGRSTYRFTYRCFMNGTGVSAGIGKGETQVRAALTSLAGKGAIEIKRSQVGLDISPNREWKPMIAVPKRLQSGVGPSENRGSEPRKSEGQTHGFPRPYIEEYLEDQVRGALRPAVADRRPGSSEDRSIPETKTLAVPVRVRTRPIPTPEKSAPVEKPRHEITEQGELMLGDTTLVAKGSSIPERLRPAAAMAKIEARRSMRHGGALFDTWKAAYVEAYGDVRGAGCVAWSKVEMAMVVKQLAKPFKGTSPELHDFIDWIVTNWGVVLAEQFRWMKREAPPELPSLRFVLAFKDKFFAAYGRRSVDRYLASLTPEERSIREAMIRKGLTEKEADQKLAERKAASALRDELERGKAEIAQQRRAASAAQARVEAERRELARMSQRAKPTPAAPVLPNGAREVSDEELAKSVQLVAKMMEVDPNGE